MWPCAGRPSLSCMFSTRRPRPPGSSSSMPAKEVSAVKQTAAAQRAPIVTGSSPRSLRRCCSLLRACSTAPEPRGLRWSYCTSPRYACVGACVNDPNSFACYCVSIPVRLCPVVAQHSPGKIPMEFTSQALGQCETTNSMLISCSRAVHPCVSWQQGAAHRSGARTPAWIQIAWWVWRAVSVDWPSFSLPVAQTQHRSGAHTPAWIRIVWWVWRAVSVDWPSINLPVAQTQHCSGARTPAWIRIVWWVWGPISSPSPHASGAKAVGG